MAVKPIPGGYPTATPYLIVKDAARATDFSQRALGAKAVMRFNHGDKVGHAEIKIGNSPIRPVFRWRSKADRSAELWRSGGV